MDLYKNNFKKSIKICKPEKKKCLVKKKKKKKKKKKIQLYFNAMTIFKCIFKTEKFSHNILGNLQQRKTNWNFRHESKVILKLKFFLQVCNKMNIHQC